MGSKLSYRWGSLRPVGELWLFDDDGSLIDFSTGYAFELKVGLIGSAALLTKTTGITGAAGAGTEPTGTPNITLTWAGTETQIGASTDSATYAWMLTATISSLPRRFVGTFEKLPIMT
ncbi:MAG TPA: hypothetical protein VK481_11395 [Gemmatimonadaceae bacterium]|nr:hypothetical protein [Gemmatimonadaceae bacterium]